MSIRESAEKGIAALRVEIAKHPRLSQLLDALQREGEVNQDAAHDVAHALRVSIWTLRLAPSEPEENCIAAALLHDLVHVEKNDPRRSMASTLSAEAAEPLLAAAGFASPDLEDICAAIQDHSYSRGAVPRSTLGDALQDADRLEGLGAIGVFRNIAVGVRLGASFFHGEDPWAEERVLDDISYSVDHYFVKLLKLPATLRTEAGRLEAKRRASRMEALLLGLSDELGVPIPSSRRMALEQNH